MKVRSKIVTMIQCFALGAMCMAWFLDYNLNSLPAALVALIFSTITNFDLD